MIEVLERLNYLLAKDTKSRWRMIGVSAVAVASAGFIAQLTGSTLADAQGPATAIGIVVFVLQGFLYTMRPALVKYIPAQTKGYLVRAALGLGTTTLLAVVAFLSAPAVDAAILNRRLRDAMLGGVSALVTHSEEVSRVFSTAIDNGVRLQGELVQRATQEASKADTPSAWEAYVAIVNYTLALRSNEGSEDGLQWHRQRLEDLTKNVAPCGPMNDKITIAEFTTKDGQITHFKDVSRWPVTINACRLTLDGTSLKDKQIDYSVVAYNGGTLNLTNVRLYFDKLELADTPNARKFAEEVLKAQDNVLTIHYD